MDTSKRTVRKVPSMEPSETSPSKKPLRQAERIEVASIDWLSLAPVNWIIEFRQALKSVVYRFTIEVHRAMGIFEELGKTHFKEYRDMVTGLQMLWAQWRQFSGVIEVDADILRSSPVFFDFKNLLISKMTTPRNSNQHKEMADIRARARQVHHDVIALQGCLEEAEMRVFETAGDEANAELGEDTGCLEFPGVMSLVSSSAVPQLRAGHSLELGEQEASVAMGHGDSIGEERGSFVIDERGHALRELKASFETEKEIRRLLPAYLQGIQFMGHVWSVFDFPVLDSDAVPLFIANAPVLLPVPCFRPTTLYAYVARPQDPIQHRIDPLQVLSDESAAVALAVFAEAESFLIFFNETFVAIYNQDVDCGSIAEYLPETFGGLCVLLANRPTIVTSNAKGKEKEEVPLESASDAGHSSSLDRLTIKPGFPIKVRGKKYGKPIPLHMDPKRIINHTDSTGTAGVLLDMDGEQYLTMATHTSATFGAQCRAADMGLVRKVVEAVWQRSQPDDWKMQIWVDGQHEPIGEVVRTFDRQSHLGYPKGYHHDLALVKLNQPTTMTHDHPLEWQIDPLTLFYNKQLQLLSKPPLVKSDVICPVKWGATVGQAIMRNESSVTKLGVRLVDGKWQYRIDALPPATANQFSRAYLWRPYGFCRSLEGWSGSPLVVHDEEDLPRSVIGFQSFQWVENERTLWTLEEEELQLHVEGGVEETIIPTRYSFYGAYFLPNVLKGSTILTTFEDDDAGKGAEAGEI